MLLDPPEKRARGGVRLQDAEVARDDHNRAAELVERVRHHAVLAGQGVVQPGVADREPEYLQQVEDEREFLAGEQFTSEPAVEDRDAEERFAVEDGNGDLRAEPLELARDLGVVRGLSGAAPEDARVPLEVRADAAAKGEHKVVEELRRKAERAGDAQGRRPAIAVRSRGGSRRRLQTA